MIVRCVGHVFDRVDAHSCVVQLQHFLLQSSGSHSIATKTQVFSAGGANIRELEGDLSGRFEVIKARSFVADSADFSG
jgi:hypothetical protein